MNRRGLLRLTPLLALGVFAVPKLQEPLLKAGWWLSDLASREMFHSGHLARTFRGSLGTMVVLHGWNNLRFHGDGRKKDPEYFVY